MSVPEQEVLVCYDVADNRARRKLFEALKDIGLVPLQKSVLWGRLRVADQRAVKREFRNHLERGSDRAFLCRVDFVSQVKDGAFGHRQADLFEFSSGDVFLD